MRSTVICHVYNEAYLLPFWLEHHRRMFDHGIIIDYDSTDGSPDIVRRMCPSWEVRTSRNREFDALEVDAEVMDVEASVQGIKMALNVTEFLLSSKPLGDHFTGANQCLHLRALAATCSTSETQDPATLAELLGGFDRVNDHARYGLRFIHTHQHGAYEVGRHQTRLPHVEPARDMHLLWFGFYPWNARQMARRSQIKHRMSQNDVTLARGFHHLMTTEQQEATKRAVQAGSTGLESAPGLREVLGRAAFSHAA